MRLNHPELVHKHPEFGVVQLYRTFSNYISSGNTRCAGCNMEFGVVRLYRTFSNYIFTGETRCAGCLCTSSGGRVLMH